MLQLAVIALPVPLPREFSYRFDPASHGDVRLRPGDLVAVPFGRRKRVMGLVTEVGDLDPGVTEVDGAALKDVAEILPEAYRITGDRLRLARWMADYYALPLGEVVPLFHPPAPGTGKRASRTEEMAYPAVDAEGLTLTPDQEKAVAAASGLLDAREFGTLLLHGVTGSGKTEVYLNIIARALELRRGAIFLLPEIALTPQTLARIEARFGDRAAAIHSGLSAGQR